MRRLHVCVRDLDALPLFARELVDMFAAEAHAGKEHTLTAGTLTP
ncbi:hypothetical protein [Paraburkholderia phytofirmans]